ncbi:MAG: enoyl-CoA hydratase/isomerase family protein [Deltaproteobacteria bacterium]|nr:enoyl-CoA hydratase/isomerase family protein [Deltaproteobacteria bacterium]
MTFRHILLTQKEHTAILTIDHPPANAWNLAAMEEFKQRLDQVENDRQTRVVILTGAGGKCFSSGFDVTDAANAPRTSPLGRELWRRVDRFPKPVIAALNGFALGGGLELALSCHFRILVDDPKTFVGLTELNLGIIPGWGGTQRLPRLVGRAKALEMILFSQRVTAQEALASGLVNQLAPAERLLAEALDLAGRLAERPPIAVAWVLKAMAAGAYEGIDAGLKAEADGSAAVRETKDKAEGFKAFLEKRKPVFTGE